jgi:two-component system invasion response regulator UvrY
MIRILICDDHLIVRQGLKQILSDAPDIEIAGEAGSGAEAMRLARQGGFDLLLLDIALPGRDGLDVLKQCRAEFPKLPVLVLSTYPEGQYAVRSLRMGASGYLNKGADVDLMMEAIRKAAAGGVFVTVSQAEALAASIRGPQDRAPHEMLSTREYQVFQLIAEGLSVAKIAERLSLSPNTVSTYRARIFEKTGATNEVEVALYAVRRNLLPV